MKLSKLPNIRKELEKKLESVGIQSLDELIESGSIKALQKISGIHDSGCLNMSYAIEGGIRWHYLSTDIRKELKDKAIDCKR
jgi:hypothetical protein